MLHLFGGMSKFGVRLDIDRVVKPHILGDAWLPPFAENSFDVVVIDPPYSYMTQYERHALFHAAGFVAREMVVWFDTIWAADYRALKLRKCWLVRPRSNCYIRCLQIFKKVGSIYPVRDFKRGPAKKYNRWLSQPRGLPFPEGDDEEPKDGG